MGLRTVVGVVKVGVWQGKDPTDKHWGCPIRERWGLRAHQQMSPAMEERVAFTATLAGSYEAAALALDFSLTAILRKAVAKRGRVFQFGTQYRSERMYRTMVEVVRNGYIGELKDIDVWCRNVHNDAAEYHVKPYGSTASA